MKHFFLKKTIFAALLLVLWLGYSVANAVFSFGTLVPVAQEAAAIHSVADARTWASKLEEEMSDALLARMPFIESYGYLQKLLGKREFNNFAYIKDANGMLYYGSTWNQGSSDVQEYALRLQRATQYAQEKGIRTLVVLPPSKLLPGQYAALEGQPLNDPNARMDALLLWMQYLDVPALDLRTAMLQSGRAQEELFFATDHHWTPLASFYASKAVVSEIATRYGHNWDANNFYLNPDNYNSYTYPAAMLGSLGRNTGMAYGGLDDYTLLWPRYTTNFTWSSARETRSGDFTRSLLDTESLSFERPYNDSINTLYINEITNTDTIYNLQDTQGPRVAVVRDSYFSPMACFLAPMCSEIDMIWSRADPERYDVEQFIREADCDYLIFEIYPHNLIEESFAFFEDAQ